MDVESLELTSIYRSADHAAGDCARIVLPRWNVRNVPITDSDATEHGKRDKAERPTPGSTADEYRNRCKSGTKRDTSPAGAGADEQSQTECDASHGETVI